MANEFQVTKEIQGTNYGSKTTKELFTTKVCIPFYQRDPKWTESIRNAFMRMIFEAFEEEADLHLGDIITTLENGERQPADGQQRILHLYLLFCAINEWESEGQKNLFPNVKELIYHEDAGNRPGETIKINKLRYEHMSSASYNGYNTNTNTDLFSWEPIKEAYNSIKKTIDEKFDSTMYLRMKDFVEFICNNIHFHVVTEPNLKKAMRTFIRKNTIYCPLEPAAVYKTMLITQVKRLDDQKDFDKRWRQVHKTLTSLTENKQFNNYPFFRMLYSAYYSTPKDTQISSDKIQALVERIQTENEACVFLQRYETLANEMMAFKGKEFESLSHICDGTWFAFLPLFCAKINNVDINRSRLLAEKACMMAHIKFGGLGNKKYEELIFKLSELIKNHTIEVVEEKMAELYNPDKNIIIPEITNLKFTSESQKKKMRKIFAIIDGVLRNNKCGLGKEPGDFFSIVGETLKKNNCHNPMTLEHIIAQSKTDDVRKHLFGNFTLVTSSVNSELSAKDFSEKREIYATIPNAITPSLVRSLARDGSQSKANRVVENFNIKPYENFTIEDVEVRGKNLAEIFMYYLDFKNSSFV